MKHAPVQLLAIVLTGLSLAVHAQENPVLTEGFRRADSNNDGKLSADEVNQLPQLKSRLQGADKNGDGLITFDEFRTHLSAESRPPVVPSSSVTRLGAGDHTRTITVGNLQRCYRVHVPKQFDADHPTPVVLAFHGGGGNPESVIRLSGLNTKSEEAGFIVVYPFDTGARDNYLLTFNGGGCCGYAMGGRSTMSASPVR